MSATEEAAAWLARLGTLLERRDTAAAAALFGDECYWRDLLAFTGNIRTMEGRGAIATTLEACLDSAAPTDWQLDGDASAYDGTIEAWLTFQTAVGRGRGHIRLRDGRAWTFLTTLQELTGFAEQQGFSRPLGVELGARRAA